MIALQEIVINNIVQDVLKKGPWKEGDTINYPNIEKLTTPTYDLVYSKLLLDYKIIKIKHEIKKDLAEIYAGYQVKDYDWVDDDPENGIVMMYHCHNGFSGENYELTGALANDNKRYFESINKDGIIVDNIVYYIHKDKDTTQIINELKLYPASMVVEYKNDMQIVIEYILDILLNLVLL